jgi:lambda family phage portal protein
MGMLSWFSKRDDVKRAPRARKATRAHARAYQAATRSRLTDSWTATTTSADAEVYKNQRVVRARSRQERRDNPHITRYFALLTNNVVGPNGINMQAQTTFNTGSSDTKANDAIEKWWRDWGVRCDTTGELSWNDVLRQALHSMAEDGETFIELVLTGAGLKLMMIDPEMVDIELNEPRPGGYIRMGIERDGSGHPVAYYLHDERKDPHLYNDGYSIGSKKYRRVPAENIIHLFARDRVGQTRGMPWTASVLWRLRMHHGYTDAAVTAARVGAAKMGFFLTSDGEQYTGDDEDEEDGEQLIDAAEPGLFEELPEGIKDFKAFDPDYPHAQFEAFDKAMTRSHAVGLNVAYHALSGDLASVNFSSIRAGVLEDREGWKYLQQLLIDGICARVFEPALTFALAAGQITVGKGALDVGRIDRYRIVLWRGRRWAWVDPLKDLEFALGAYKLGVTSLTEICMDMGKDLETVLVQRQKEDKLLATYGVTPEEALGAAAKPEPAASTPPKQDDDDDD